MRAFAVSSLLLAVVLGIVAIRNYSENSKKRDMAISQMSLLTADSPLRSSYLEEIAKLDTEQRNDKIVGLIAGLLLIGSVALSSRSAVAPHHDPHRHGPLA